MKPLAALLFVLMMSTAGAAQQAPAGQPPNTDDPNYRRPSAPALQPFNLGYFQGTWTFDWDVPDSVFGEGGPITGTETYTCDDRGLSCESIVKAESPAGAFTQQVRLRYNDATKTITRDEKDSRGFAVHYVGHVSSDQGLYQIAYTSNPFKYKGKTLKLTSASSLSAPTAFRMRVQLAVDNQPSTSYGSPWWRLRPVQ
jgi:hypothetical protein